MIPIDISPQVKKYLAELGRKGGTSRSDKKINSARSNIEKARAKLAQKRVEKK